MNVLNIALLILVVALPTLTAIRAYRKGYQAGIKDSKTRETIRNRYSRSPERHSE